MIIPARRPLTRLVVLTAIVATAVSVVSETVSAQVRCYRTKCVVFPDGLRVCERTPVDCATIE